VIFTDALPAILQIAMPDENVHPPGQGQARRPVVAITGREVDDGPQENARRSVPPEQKVPTEQGHPRSPVGRRDPLAD